MVKAGAAAHRAAQSKSDKYTHIFCPLAIEIAGAAAIEVTQEIGRRITVVTEDTRETEVIFHLFAWNSPLSQILLKLAYQ